MHAFPGVLDQPFFPACGALRNSLLFLPERALVCTHERAGAVASGRAVLLPYVNVNDLRAPLPAVAGSTRTTLLFYRGGCGNRARPGSYSSGKLLRAHVTHALTDLAQRFNLTQGAGRIDVRGAARLQLKCLLCSRDTRQGCSDRVAALVPAPPQVDCSCEMCPRALTHRAVMDRLYDSLFCPVMPGDTQVGRVGRMCLPTPLAAELPSLPPARAPCLPTPLPAARRLPLQSSRRLTEVVLAGCLPVFFGPPYHTLPLADAINYTSFSGSCKHA